MEEWKAFGPFRDFYEEDLEGGSTFLEDFDMKILGHGFIVDSWLKTLVEIDLPQTIGSLHRNGSNTVRF